jgi:MFS family permease
MGSNRIHLMNAVLSEYKALRAELMEHTRAMYLLSTVVSTVIAGAFTAGALAWDKAVVPAFIFNLIIPLLLLAGGILILTTTHKGAAISKYLKEKVEEKVEILLGGELQEWFKDVGLPHRVSSHHKVMGWETWVRKMGNDGGLPLGVYFFPYIAIFACILVSTLVIGEYRTFLPSGWEDIPVILRYGLRFSPLLPLVAGAYVCLFWYKRLRDL